MQMANTTRLLIAFVGFFCCSIEAAKTPPAKPNFILIMADNLGYGDIGPFGSKLHRTPNLDRMAREGRRLTSFYSASGVCTPSRAALMTGCYPRRVGLDWTPEDGHVLRPVSPNGLHPNEVTIAEVLKKAGYATACIGKWHLGDQPEFLPTRQGFDYYLGLPYSDDMTHATGQRIGERLRGNQWPPLPWMENEKVIEAPADRNQMTQRETAAALKFIATNKAKPFFLYLPHNMPGSSRQPFSSERFRGKSKNGAWGDAVEELDWAAGQIFAALKKQTSTNARSSFGPATTALRAVIHSEAATAHSAAGATPPPKAACACPPSSAGPATSQPAARVMNSALSWTSTTPSPNLPVQHCPIANATAKTSGPSGARTTPSRPTSIFSIITRTNYKPSAINVGNWCLVNRPNCMI